MSNNCKPCSYLSLKWQESLDMVTVTSYKSESEDLETDVGGHTGPEETNLGKNVGAELIPEITAGAVTRVAGAHTSHLNYGEARHHLLLTIQYLMIF